MNATTTTKSITTCSAEVGSPGWSRYARKCSHKATSFEQPQRVLPNTHLTQPLGERSEIDILMGVDTREAKTISLPTYGPVQPMPFCGTHSPAKRAQRDNAKREAEMEARRRRDNTAEVWMGLTEALRAAIATEDSDFKWDVMVATDREFNANGVKLSSRAVRRLLEVLGD